MTKGEKIFKNEILKLMCHNDKVSNIPVIGVSQERRV
jgi:hypothetical protein